MPRRPRVILPKVLLHIIHLGNDRQAGLVVEEDCSFDLDWLHGCAGNTACCLCHITHPEIR